MADSIERLDDGAVTFVTLNNPAKFNAMTRAMWPALQKVFEDLERESAGGGPVRCVVVRGAGANFCAGGDIAQYPAFRFQAAELQHFHEAQVWGALRAMLLCNVPVIACIEGNCMGAGLEIASCCDLRMATPQARFGAPIARLGFPMAPREANLVSQVLGSSAARAMLLAAEIWDAQRLHALGFLSQMADSADLPDAALRTAQRIADLAPQAARLNKQQLNAALLAQAPTDASNYDYAANFEHVEGITAFLEKRKPEF